MDHNLSFGQDPLETSSLPISLFDNHLSSFSNDDTVYGILAYIAAVVLLVYALVSQVIIDIFLVIRDSRLYKKTHSVRVFQKQPQA